MLDDTLVQRLIGLVFYATVVSLLRKLFSEHCPPGI